MMDLKDMFEENSLEFVNPSNMEGKKEGGMKNARVQCDAIIENEKKEQLQLRGGVEF